MSFFQYMQALLAEGDGFQIKQPIDYAVAVATV